MNYDIFRFEKELILNAALKMINDGQIRYIGLPEIAHYSGLAEGTVRKIFQSTENILNELSTHIAESISANTEMAIKGGLGFKDQFKLVWHALLKYYQQNPQILALVQSPKNMHMPEIEMISGIVDFFKRNEDSVSGKIEPELLALIFHGNIITAAKISVQSDSTMQAEEISFMPEILWSGLTAQGMLDRREAGLFFN